VNVVIADKLEKSVIQALEEMGARVSVQPGIEGDALAAACGDAHVLIVRSTKVPAAVFERSRKLSLVIRAGAGVNTIDVRAAAAHGVFVANCPGKNAIAVAELAMGLLISIDRRIPDNVAALRAGRWEKGRFSAAAGLAGRTLGIVGLGDIGAEVAVRARAFGMHVVAWSRSLTDARSRELGVARMPSLEALFECADAVSLHLALVPETKGLVGAALLSRMKPGAILINTARAEIVDEPALLDAMRTRGLRVGADVLSGEPSGKSAELRHALGDAQGAYVTHHIGASTEQAQEAVAQEVVRIVRAFRDTGTVPNCVNLCARSSATHQLAVRHEDRVGVLASVLGAIKEHHLNVEEMENVIFDGLRAACCFIRVSAEPAEGVVAAIEALPHVLGVGVYRLAHPAAGADA
jgi:D-3-phosphoglycerate dehydrogenase